MTDYELYSLVISFFTLIVAIGGIYMALRQLKTTQEMTLLQLKENYDIKVKEYQWNKAVYAQEKLATFKDINISALKLNDKLDYLNNNQVLKLELILDEISKNPEIKVNIHDILNFYESLARGVKHGIYDEKVIKAAREGAMRRMVKSYKKYIEYRREIEQHPNAWNYLTDLVNKWEDDSKQKVEEREHFLNENTL